MLAGRPAGASDRRLTPRKHVEPSATWYAAEVMKPLPVEIVQDLHILLDPLRSLGFIPTDGQYDSDVFGNYYASFLGPKGRLRIIRDRSQYMVEGDPALLERAGLWRAFDDREEFAARLLFWLEGTV